MKLIKYNVTSAVKDLITPGNMRELAINPLDHIPKNSSFAHGTRLETFYILAAEDSEANVVQKILNDVIDLFYKASVPSNVNEIKTTSVEIWRDMPEENPCNAWAWFSHRDKMYFVSSTGETEYELEHNLIYAYWYGAVTGLCASMVGTLKDNNLECLEENDKVKKFNDGINKKVVENDSIAKEIFDIITKN